MVVTNVVNPGAFWLKLVVFGLRLTTFVTEAVAGRLKSRWFDDVCNVGRPPVARPGLAAAHGCRSLAPTPPLLACACVGLKPMSPLLAQAEPQLKPPSPLRGENAVIPGVVGLQRCWRFHWSTPGGVQRCCWFQSRHVAAPCARKSSPCAAWCGREREKVRPANPKWPKNAVFRRAGRTFSRKCRWKPCAGRLMSRSSLSCSLWACVIRAASFVGCSVPGIVGFEQWIMKHERHAARSAGIHLRAITRSQPPPTPTADPSRKD